MQVKAIEFPQAVLDRVTVQSPFCRQFSCLSQSNVLIKNTTFHFLKYSSLNNIIFESSTCKPELLRFQKSWSGGGGRLVGKLCPTLLPHGLQSIRLLCPWHFPGKNTGVDCHFFLQGIFLTQGRTHISCTGRQSLPLRHQGSPSSNPVIQ